jgi:hypothetical protein
MVLYTCNQYPVRKLILVGDKVEEIILYKYPVNGVPPTNQSSTASNKQDGKNNRNEKKNP